MGYFNRPPLYLDPKEPEEWITVQELAYKWDLTPQYIEHHRRYGVFDGLIKYDHRYKRWLYHSEAIEILSVDSYGQKRPSNRPYCVCDDDL
jgi:hypothetical protein